MGFSAPTERQRSQSLLSVDDEIGLECTVQHLGHGVVVRVATELDWANANLTTPTEMQHRFTTWNQITSTTAMPATA
jgi:hypothetical protein